MLILSRNLVDINPPSLSVEIEYLEKVYTYIYRCQQAC